ncbi:hypothetical protein R5R35_012802 [Gryllus longicercus]|uniref:Uncharacterized protein n=1 Tax=Gryllus longicercus TaxID=2509291 RepID=A0AAN9VB14_9ORTH
MPSDGWKRLRDITRNKCQSQVTLSCLSIITPTVRAWPLLTDLDFGIAAFPPGKLALRQPHPERLPATRPRSGTKSAQKPGCMLRCYDMHWHRPCQVPGQICLNRCQ